MNVVIHEKEKAVVETKLYCPLLAYVDRNTPGEYMRRAPNTDLLGSADKINKEIRKTLGVCGGDDEVERGIIVWLSQRLDNEIYSVFPSVEEREGKMYGVLTIKSYDELSPDIYDKLLGELTGELAEGWGAGFLNYDILINSQNYSIAFWNSGEFYLKPESEVFPSGEIKMGGI